ncbi:MAG: hypothetical protein ACI9NY_001436 [Kiritimatiellia bacterium]|jgi:hypothetical protein
MAEDNAQAIKQWMEDNQLMPTTDQQAQEWQTQDSELWAAVIKPWILVQVNQKAALAK